MDNRKFVTFHCLEHVVMAIPVDELDQILFEQYKKNWITAVEITHKGKITRLVCPAKDAAFQRELQAIRRAVGN